MGFADLGMVYVRYEDMQDGRVRELTRSLGRGLMETRTTSQVSQAPRFYLAAAAAEFAEVLRGSDHVEPVGMEANLAAVRGVLEEVVAQLPLDRQAAELLELVRLAPGLPGAE